MRRLLDSLASPHSLGELLQALDPRWGSRLAGAPRLGVIESVTPTGLEAATLRIRPGHGWRTHHPGQFVVLGVDVDGVRRHRSYTITSLPGAPHGCIEVTVQGGRGGEVSEHLVNVAAPGDLVALEGPAGEFTLPEVPGAPILFLSAGSGLTPVMAMLRSLAAESMWSSRRGRAHLDVVVVHHVASAPATLFGGELEALGAAMPWLTVEIVLTRDDEGRAVPDTHLSATRLDSLCPDWRGRETWACGPAGMLAAVEGVWAATAGTAALHTEAFHTVARADLRRRDPGAEAEVRFGASGITGRGDESTPLLDVAEAVGAGAQVGCRMGICHTCATELAEGYVVDLRDGRRSGPGGHVQLCVNAALTDVTLVL